MWGIVFLVIGQFARLQYHRTVMLFMAVVAFIHLLLMRIRVHSHVVGQYIFPDASLLNNLIVVCAVVFFMAMIDSKIRWLLCAISKRLFKRTHSGK